MFNTTKMILSSEESLTMNSYSYLQWKKKKLLCILVLYACLVNGNESRKEHNFTLYDDALNIVVQRFHRSLPLDDVL